MGLVAGERRGRRYLLAFGALVLFAGVPVTAHGSSSRLVPSATFSSSVAVGQVAETGSRIQQPDLVEGTWLQFSGPGGAQLARIYENGRVQAAGLPPQLRDERLKVFPLENGWTIALDRFLPASRAGKDLCEGVEEPELGEPGCGDDWVLAERSPRGRWVLVQALAHSRNNRSWVSDPVEHHGRIEIAWGEPYEEAVRVSEAPLGHPFGPPHLVRHLLPRQFTDSIAVDVRLGGLYEVADYGPDAGENEPDFIAERRLYGDGRFGPVHVLRSHLLYEKGTFFDVPGGSQLYLYGSGFSEKLLVARRAPFASSLERPRVALASPTGTLEETQSFNGRLLIASEERVPAGSEHEAIAAVSISTRAVPGPMRVLESQAVSATRYFAGAIGDDGEWLVASTTAEGGPLWLHPSSPGCAYREQKITAPTRVSHEHTALALSAGRRGVFHVAWVDTSNELRTASVRVGCVARS
jgi:hypothetical protein